MLAGHLGAGLAIGAGERRINPGVFVLAGLLLDAVLWVLVLAGWESVTIPADFATSRQPEYVFPYSHGLLASLAWSAAAGAAVWAAFPSLAGRRWRAALLAGAAVFSHWLLDALVHRPELPLAGTGSPAVGLGFWSFDLDLALGFESLIAAVGVGLYLARGSLPRGRALGLLVLSILVLVLTVVGMTSAPPPPSPAAMAGGSLVTLIAIAAVAAWIGRRRARI